MTSPRRIRHGGVSLAVHERPGAAGRPLLLLHELGGSGGGWLAGFDLWPGAVLALDFAGHGASEWRAGGAYTPELFAADADAVVAALGPCAVAGAGVGAYVALLLAGSRPDLVPAALLLPGRGLDGGGTEPDPSRPVPMLQSPDVADGFDPMARSCELDLRPVDYAVSFARAAPRLVLADGSPRPPWWRAIREVSGVQLATGDAFAALAAAG